MTREDVARAVVKSIIEIYQLGGRALSADGKIDGSLRPLEDLEGFDSLNVIETVALIESELQVTIKPESLLAPSTGASPDIDTMVARICKQIGVS